MLLECSWIAAPLGPPRAGMVRWDAFPFTQDTTPRLSYMFIPVPTHPGGYKGVEKLPKHFPAMPLAAARSAHGCPREAGVMLPAPCRPAIPVLFPAGSACLLPAHPSKAAPALAAHWECCMGPGCSSGPGLPTCAVDERRFLPGQRRWQPLERHPALSRSRLNLFPPPFPPGSGS